VVVVFSAFVDLLFGLAARGLLQRSYNLVPGELGRENLSRTGGVAMHLFNQFFSPAKLLFTA
jgi:hypothetical protein